MSKRRYVSKVKVIDYLTIYISLSFDTYNFIVILEKERREGSERWIDMNESRNVGVSVCYLFIVSFSQCKWYFMFHIFSFFFFCARKIFIFSFFFHSNNIRFPFPLSIILVVSFLFFFSFFFFFFFFSRTLHLPFRFLQTHDIYYYF